MFGFKNQELKMLLNKNIKKKKNEVLSSSIFNTKKIKFYRFCLFFRFWKNF